jgi:hypothetical protein
MPWYYRVEDDETGEFVSRVRIDDEDAMVLMLDIAGQLGFILSYDGYEWPDDVQGE